MFLTGNQVFELQIGPKYGLKLLPFLQRMSNFLQRSTSLLHYVTRKLHISQPIRLKKVCHLFQLLTEAWKKAVLFFYSSLKWVFFSGCLKSVAFSSSAVSEPTETSLQNTRRFRGSETYPLLIEGQTLKGCKSDTTIPPWKVPLLWVKLWKDRDTFH